MVTIRDVARKAGVSIATVSRVFNGSSRVSPTSSRNVRAAAKRLDYWPHGGARSLTTSHTHAIGVLLPDLFGDFFSEVIRGIDQAARAENYQILVSSSHADTEEMLAAARFMQGRIDGLIAMVPDKGSAAAIRRIARRFPVVLLNPRFDVAGCGTVSIANYEGACAAVEHLIQLGHRRIAILKGPAGNVDAEERLRGYQKALRDAGLRPEPELELQGDFSQAGGHRLAPALLRLVPRPTAVFAANDCMAVGLLSALRDVHIEVPRDLAVTGFDDIAISRYLNPPLTTVRVEPQVLGQRATHALIASIRVPGTQPPAHAVLPAALVVRVSCGSSPLANGRRAAQSRPRVAARS